MASAIAHKKASERVLLPVIAIVEQAATIVDKMKLSRQRVVRKSQLGLGGAVRFPKQAAVRHRARSDPFAAADEREPDFVTCRD